MAFGKRRRLIQLNPFAVIWLLLIIGFITALITLKLQVISPIQLGDISIGQYLIAKRRLAENIFSQLPAAKRVRFKPDWFHFLVEIEIDQEQPIAFICGSNCYNLGQSGYIFKTQTPPLKELIPITSQLEIKDISILDRKIAQALSKVFEFSLVKKIPLKRVEIFSNRDLKFFLSSASLTENQQRYFLIDPNESIAEQLDKLDKFLKHKQSTKFESADLRIPGKVYYK